MKRNLLLLFAILFCTQIFAQINSIRPDTGYQGQFLRTYITMVPGSFTNASPPYANTDIWLENGTTTIYADPSYGVWTNVYQCWSMWCDSMFVDFDIPSSAQTGYYNLHVTTYDFLGNPIYDVLPSSFEVKSVAGTIEGDIYFDMNQNGIWDGGEPPLMNHKAVLNPGGVIAFTNSNGHYKFFCDTGSYTVSYQPNISFTQTSLPVTYSATIPPSVTGFDFGSYSAQTLVNQYFYVWHHPMRCAPSHGYTYVDITNNGLIPVQGSITMVHSNNMPFNNSGPAPDIISGDTLTWYYPLLNPGQSYHIGGASGNWIVFDDPAAGQTVWFNTIDSVFDALGNPLTQYADSFSFLVTCSCDPNDKHVFPPGESPAHITPPGSTLNYTINFQNTGNDTAFTVIIKDTLDANLDWNTFELISSTHPVYAQLDPSGVLTFTFNNILLPDSNVDEPGSHGAVVYRIAVDSLLPDPTTVYNTAYIYFDANPAVVTNTAFNTLTVLQYPSASYVMSGVSLCPGTCTDFVNQSANATSYLWTFNGSSTPSSTDTNPANICYNNPGNYDVTLIATNVLGSDTLIAPNYVLVYPQPPAQSVIQSGDTLISLQAFTVYQWFYQGDTIPGATSSWYIATMNGDYSLICVDANGCSVETVILNVITSVNSVPPAGTLSIYPNPVQDRILIRNIFDSGRGIEVTIYNAVGQRVRSIPSVQTRGISELVIPAAGLDKGVYTIEMTDGERVYRNHFVKE